MFCSGGWGEHSPQRGKYLPPPRRIFSPGADQSPGRTSVRTFYKRKNGPGPTWTKNGKCYQLYHPGLHKTALAASPQTRGPFRAWKRSFAPEEPFGPGGWGRGWTLSPADSPSADGSWISVEFAATSDPPEIVATHRVSVVVLVVTVVDEVGVPVLGGTFVQDKLSDPLEIGYGGPGKSL